MVFYLPGFGGIYKRKSSCSCYRAIFLVQKALGREGSGRRYVPSSEREMAAQRTKNM